MHRSHGTLPHPTAFLCVVQVVQAAHGAVAAGFPSAAAPAAPRWLSAAINDDTREAASAPAGPCRLEDVLQLLDSVGSQRQFLVGSSIGAWLALHAALRRPDLVQARGRCHAACSGRAGQRPPAAPMAPPHRRLAAAGALGGPAGAGQQAGRHAGLPR